MSYGNVGTPRFYVNWGEWWLALGNQTAQNNLWRLNPSQKKLVGSNDQNYYEESISGNGKGVNFLAVLNHEYTEHHHGDNTESAGMRIYAKLNDAVQNAQNTTEIINASSHGSGFCAIKKGYSIGTFNPFDDTDTITFRLWQTGNTSHQIGSVVFGKYYDMPFSPDLSLSVGREYGLKQITAKGGSTLSHANWVKPPKWGDLDAWQLEGDDDWHYSGRRVWNLSFNYVSESDLEPSAYSEDESNFFSDVVHKTMGGHLPFIFQPDNEVSDFAIARFDMKTFRKEQVANRVYKISLNIRESW